MSKCSNLLGVIRRRSRLYRTPAYPVGSGPDFVNGAFAIETEKDANAILRELHEVEEHLGRTRERRWGPRTLDLDLIALEQVILPDVDVFAHWRDLPPDRQTTETPEELILPHPRMHERAFVLVPMAEIAADWTHPVLQRTVREMLDDLPKEHLKEVKRL